jgi:hypothetical protein
MPSAASSPSSNLLDTIYNASRTLLAEGAANNLTAAISLAGKTLESFFLQGRTAEPDKPPSWQEQVYEHINTFIASRSSLENTSLLLALCTFLFLLVRNMSWTSRLGNLGRFSPFTRSPTSGAPRVSDSDFSYITADDLRRHQQESVTSQQRSESPTDYGPQRETDVVVLRNKKREHAMHFPAYSIAKGELKVGSVRDAAAKKMNTYASQVKLLHRGKNLKDDARTCKQEGLRDGSEIMCTIAENMPDGDADSSDEDGEESVEDGQADGEGVKKRRNRGKRTKRRNRREANDASGTSTPERLGVPLSTTSTRTPSRPQSPKPPPTPATPIDKLSALHNTLMSFDKDVQSFLQHPPAEQSKREFEHKRLSETILTQVLLKLDAVETDGDADARTRRKELVKETQGILNKLDAAMKG